MVLIHIYKCVWVYWSLCVLFICLCVISNQSTGKNHVIRVKPSVNLIPCYWHCRLVLMLQAQQVSVHNIIKQNSTLDLAWSSIQPKKQGNKKSRWEGGWTKFEKRAVSNIGGSHIKRGVRNPLPTLHCLK